MRLAEFYPAKNRIFSPGRWEAWNKLPASSNQTKKYFKIRKIRGTNDNFQNKPDNKIFMEIEYLHSAHSNFHKTLYIQPKDNSSGLRFSGRNIIKNTQNQKILQLEI